MNSNAVIDGGPRVEQSSVSSPNITNLSFVLGTVFRSSHR